MGRLNLRMCLLHRWKPEGIMSGGSVVEHCLACGRRRVYVMDRGVPCGMAVYSRESWENANFEKKTAEDLRGSEYDPTPAGGASCTSGA